MAEEREDRDLNQDPITGEPGAHPVGTGLGSAGGAVAGATVGAIGGPIGAAVGGVAGAVLGGLAGKRAAEAIDPTAEEAHWRQHHTKEPYYEQGRSFDDYLPAYRMGLTGRTEYGDDWLSVEDRLEEQWGKERGTSTLEWDKARHPARAAWDRADSLIKGSGAAAAVGSMQSAGDKSGDRKDVIDTLQDLMECSLDGEYGFRECADQAKRPDLRAVFLARADDCRRAVQDLSDMIDRLGGHVMRSGSMLGAAHRGWVAVKSALTSYDDKAVLKECERGEDNAKARYMKAMEKPLPIEVKALVEKQYQGVLRNHDEIKRLRDSF
ncbi:ferritin-like domain-containing protein [Ramlibacter albus]|uniref:PA2169 family four-helix-bundle protein n=1 Tax=Ramlibacter albus TaxID=2079448 RepID=A0A923S2K4_9BURK|nr:PA2169 family four-helix-bundle protein [Ramlibacter albus]MBC5764858.1 PA2169 family four-helix-bundle protein [Ramlibacter albus]